MSVRQDERCSVPDHPHYLGSPRQRWYVLDEIFKQYDIYPPTSRTVLVGQSSVVAHRLKNRSLTSILCRASTLVKSQATLLSFPGII